ncbi:hypothetical protein KIPB_003924, partial [Kipferlia bialata]|eukprot:g3924.t1
MPHVTFSYVHPTPCTSVCIGGMFNQWEPEKMTPTEAGWTLSVELEEGLHPYKYHVDGEWVHDPTMPSYTDTEGPINNYVRVLPDSPPLDLTPVPLPPLDDTLPYGYEEDGVLTHRVKRHGFQFSGDRDYQTLNEGYVMPYIQRRMAEMYQVVPLCFPGDTMSTLRPAYVSEGLMGHRGRVLVLIPGSGLVEAGIWGRALCCNDSLQTGSMLPYLAQAEREGYKVVVMNPNRRHRYDLDHTLAVWRHLVLGSAASEIYVVAHSYGGIAVAHILSETVKEREGDAPAESGMCVNPRLTAVALTDSVHGGSRYLHGAALEWLGEVAVQYRTSPNPVDTLECALGDSMEGCEVRSAGVMDHASTNEAAREAIFNRFRQKW